MKKYKVNLSKIRTPTEHHLKLVKREIEVGDGFVQLNEENGVWANISSFGSNRHFLGDLWVSKSSLEEV